MESSTYEIKSFQLSGIPLVSLNEAVTIERHAGGERRILTLHIHAITTGIHATLGRERKPEVTDIRCHKFKNCN